MIPREITVTQQQELPAHLTLTLKGAEEVKVAPPVSAEEKVIAFVNGLQSSPLFEQQRDFLKKWQAEALPDFVILDSRDKKMKAAENLALLFIGVIVPAKLVKANLRKQRDVDLHKKALEVLLKAFLPVGSSPAAFLAEQQAADKMTAQLVAQMAIASHVTALKLQALEAEEEALNQMLQTHLAYMQAAYLQIADSNQEQTEAQRKSFLALGVELQEIHQALKSKVIKTADIALKLQASEKALQLALASCQTTLNKRITR